jgi:hypothetical protein
MSGQLRELLTSDVLLEMAYTQKKAERVIAGLEKSLNDHLLKLWTIPDSLDRSIWIEDLVDWIGEIAEIVLRPRNARPSHIFYYRLLFFEPFGGGVEIPNILRRLHRLHRQGYPVQSDITSTALLMRLQKFHRDLANLCAARLMFEEQIRQFIADH